MKFFVAMKFLLLSIAFHGIAADVQTAEEVSQHISVTKDGNVLSNPDFSIDCLGCSVVGDISFSGGCDKDDCLKQWAPDANFSMLPFDFTEYWLGMAVDDFKIHVELDINLTPAHPTNEIIIPLIGSNGLDIPFSKDGPFSTDFRINPEIHGWVNSTSEANFTYGFDIVIPANSAIMIPVLHLDNIKTYGFGNSTITPTSFKSSNPDLQFDFELSFRFLVAFDANFIGDIFTESVSFAADVPNINLAVTQALDVTSNCEPPPAGTDPSHIYKNLTHVVPSVSYDAIFNISHAGSLEFGPFDGTALATSCLDYSSKETGLIPAPEVNPTSGQASVVVPLFACLMVVALTAMLMG